MPLKGKALTIAFPLIDSTLRPSRKSGLSFSSGDSKISKDGSSFVNTTNTPTELGSTGRYKLDLTATEMNADFVLIEIVKSGIDDFDMMMPTSSHPSGVIVSDGGNTETTFKTDRSESTTDYWKDCLLLFTSGLIAGQIKKITGYNGSTKFITVSGGFTSTPNNDDRFVIVDI